MVGSYTFDDNDDGGGDSSYKRSAPSIGAPQHKRLGNEHTSYNPQYHHYHNSQQQQNAIISSIRSTFTNLKHQLQTNIMPPNNQSIATFLSGTIAFYTTALSTQYIQYKVLKVSTGTRPTIIPTTLGLITVALGSWISHLAGLGTTAAYSTIQQSWNNNRLNGIIQSFPEISNRAIRSVDEMVRPMKISVNDLSRGERRERKDAWMHAARICVLGLLTYKTIFRSNFISLSPSSYTARGSFARIGIPAPPNFSYATKAQRAKLESIGKWWGCHTCGSRMIFSNMSKHKFNGDHIPPVSVAKQINSRWYRKPLGWKVSQKFYPQCRNCSNKQGGLLSSAVNAGHRNLHSVGGGQESYFHGRRLRIGHLTGGAVAVLSIGSANADGKNEVELAESSRNRVFSIQNWVEDTGRDLRDRVETAWRDFW